MLFVGIRCCKGWKNCRFLVIRNVFAVIQHTNENVVKNLSEA